MANLVTIPADRLSDLEQVAAAADAWLHAWVSAQTITSATDGKTAHAFEASKRLAATIQSARTRPA